MASSEAIHAFHAMYRRPERFQWRTEEEQRAIVATTAEALRLRGKDVITKYETVDRREIWFNHHLEIISEGDIAVFTLREEPDGHVTLLRDGKLVDGSVTSRTYALMLYFAQYNNSCTCFNPLMVGDVVTVNGETSRIALVDGRHVAVFIDGVMHWLNHAQCIRVDAVDNSEEE